MLHVFPRERSVVTSQSTVRLAEAVQEEGGGRAASALKQLLELAEKEVSEEEAWAEFAIFREV